MVPADLVSDEGPLPNLQTAVFLLYHMYSREGVGWEGVKGNKRGSRRGKKD